MYFIFAHLLIVFLLRTYQTAQIHNAETDYRIIGGFSCNTDDYVFIVSIRLTLLPVLNDQHICGGSLIRPNWVMTAAHCIEPEISYTVTRFYTESSGGVARQNTHVKNIVVHPNYTHASDKDDISLLELKKHLLQEIVDVLPQKSMMRECTEGLAMGWGFNQKMESDGMLFRQTFSTDTELYCVTVPFITNEACSAFYKYPIRPTQLCTLDAKGLKGTCAGDSGGPLMCNRTIIGITSYGKGCALPDGPNVFTNVVSYIDFIQNTLKNRGSLRSQSFITLTPLYLYWNYR